MEQLKNIVVTNLVKSYNNISVLDKITFDVNAGEFLTILGPSGCGKTTLLKILIGVETPDSGSILKNGENLIIKPMNKRGMGIVFQNYALFENMTEYQNIAYAIQFHAELKSRKTEITNELISLMQLDESRDKYPRHLSGGQQQRVAIARTLALNPDIILFDEPMSALDVDTRNQLRREIKDIQKKYGTTMIYITHDQEEAFTMSDRIMVMNEGAIQQLDTPRNIFNNPANDFIQSFVLDNIQLKIDSLIEYSKVAYEKK